MSTARTYVILGGAGKTGSRVADLLERRGHRAIRASRHGERPFDWADPTTWAAALAGADGLYAAYSPDLAAPGAIQIVGAVATQAAAAGVDRAVLLSGRGEEAARAGEQAFLAALSGAAVVRCAWFDQNFTEGIFTDAIAHGVLSLPAPGSATEPFIDADDIAECVVALLTTEKPVAGVHELTGPEILSLAEVATTLGEATGRAVHYREATLDEFATTLTDQGVPAEAAQELAHTFATTFDGRNAATTRAVEALLGRPARTFADFARRAGNSNTYLAAPRVREAS